MPNPFYYDRPLPPEEAIDRPAERRRLAELAEGGQAIGDGVRAVVRDYQEAERRVAAPFGPGR